MGGRGEGRVVEGEGSSVGLHMLPAVDVVLLPLHPPGWWSFRGIAASLFASRLLLFPGA